MGMFKRYIVCAWDNYYPCGGLGNIVGTFDEWSEVQTFLDLKQTISRCDYVCIYDQEKKTDGHLVTRYVNGKEKL